ncbi:MAG: nitric oxide reductase [Nitrospirae bacterium]|nr:nitric oxide reductase [Nitrospirota bacterium]
MIPGKVGLAVGTVAGIAFIRWATSGGGTLNLALALLLTAVFIMWLGYMIPPARMILVSVGFFTLMSGIFASYSNWLPQVRGEVPVVVVEKGGGTKPEDMPADKLAEKGAAIIFADPGALEGQGKGQCPLCHGFKKGALSERAPNLSGIPQRAAERVKDPRYLKPDSVQTESFSGSGRATTAVEYIAESHSCPNCFIVAGYGVKGSNDRESPMPVIYKPPIELSIDELIAVDTWLFYREGGDVPPASEIRAAYEKFIPAADRKEAPKVEAPAAPGPVIAMGTDTPEDMIKKMGCGACHTIPTTANKFGAIGPVLIEKTNAPKRISSPEYQARVKAGKAHATTPKQYIIESIMNPSAFIVPAFVNKGNPDVSIMPPDFSKKFTYEAVEKLADFLLSIDAAAASKDGIKIDKDGRKAAG